MIVKSSSAPLPPLKSVKVLDQLPERIRYLHYSIRTEEGYVHWVRAFIRFHGLRHQRHCGRQRYCQAQVDWLVLTLNRLT
jgi:Phage integrase, N-terminal SAM-like domain